MSLRIQSSDDLFASKLLGLAANLGDTCLTILQRDFTAMFISVINSGQQFSGLIILVGSTKYLI